MSKDLLPSFSEAKSTLESIKQQPRLTGASRVQALEKELKQLDQITEMVDNAIESIDATAHNMDVIISTTKSTNHLLDLWIRILSQTSHTSNVLNDKNWKGNRRTMEELEEQQKRFEELEQKYLADKEKKEQEAEAQRQRQRLKEQRQQEREEAFKRRVYGRSSTRPSTAPKTPRSSSRPRK